MKSKLLCLFLSFLVVIGPIWAKATTVYPVCDLGLLPMAELLAQARVRVAANEPSSAVAQELRRRANEEAAKGSITAEVQAAFDYARKLEEKVPKNWKVSFTPLLREPLQFDYTADPTEPFRKLEVWVGEQTLSLDGKVVEHLYGALVLAVFDRSDERVRALPKEESIIFNYREPNSAVAARMRAGRDRQMKTDFRKWVGDRQQKATMSFLILSRMPGGYVDTPGLNMAFSLDSLVTGKLGRMQTDMKDTFLKVFNYLIMQNNNNQYFISIRSGSSR